MKPRKDGYYHKNFTYEGRRYHISAGTEKELMIKYGKMLQQLADGSLAINQNSTVLHWVRGLARHLQSREHDREVTLDLPAEAGRLYPASDRQNEDEGRAGAAPATHSER